MFGNFNVGVENLQPLHATNSDKKTLPKAALIKYDIYRITHVRNEYGTDCTEIWRDFRC